MTSHPPAALEARDVLQEEFDLALLDLDGVVYVGPDPVPGAPAALQQARAAGMAMSFVTNNASRPASTVAAHLRELGVDAADDEVVTSAMAAASLLARRHPPGAPILVVGGEGLFWALRNVGLRPVSSVAEAEGAPAAVVQGFHPDIGWRLLAEGTRAIRGGAPWLATNTDLTVPTPFGPAPGNGTLVAAVSTAVGITPEVAGKPRPTLFQEAVARVGSARPLVVGDRLDTDLEGARAAGIPGLLVLTGVTDLATLLSCPPQRRPDLVVADLHGLAAPHPSATAEAGEAGRVSGLCRDARVDLVEDGSGYAVRIVSEGEDRLDLVRAASVAAWTVADATQAAPRCDLAELLGALRALPGPATTAW
ncbi:MAG: HAD-IIA family hydrolase [Kineosporiaceae bacterium]